MFDISQKEKKTTYFLLAHNVESTSDRAVIYNMVTSLESSNSYFFSFDLIFSRDQDLEGENRLLYYKISQNKGTRKLSIDIRVTDYNNFFKEEMRGTPEDYPWF
jgi:hypothetical protein